MGATISQCSLTFSAESGGVCWSTRPILGVAGCDSSCTACECPCPRCENIRLSAIDWARERVSFKRCGDAWWRRQKIFCTSRKRNYFFFSQHRNINKQVKQQISFVLLIAITLAPSELNRWSSKHCHVFDEHIRSICALSRRVLRDKDGQLHKRVRIQAWRKEKSVKFSFATNYLHSSSRIGIGGSTLEKRRSIILELARDR